MELDEFNILFYPTSKAIQKSFLTAFVEREDFILKTLYDNLAFKQNEQLFILPGIPRNQKDLLYIDNHPVTNTWYYEVTSNPPAIGQMNVDNVLLEVEFTRPRTASTSFSANEFTKELDNRRNLFNKQFSQKFPIDSNRYSEKQVISCEFISILFV